MSHDDNRMKEKEKRMFVKVETCEGICQNPYYRYRAVATRWPNCEALYLLELRCAHVWAEKICCSWNQENCSKTLLYVEMFPSQGLITETFVNKWHVLLRLNRENPLHLLCDNRRAEKTRIRSPQTTVGPGRLYHRSQGYNHWQGTGHTCRHKTKNQLWHAEHRFPLLKSVEMGLRTSRRWTSWCCKCLQTRSHTGRHQTLERSLRCTWNCRANSSPASDRHRPEHTFSSSSV